LPKVVVKKKKRVKDLKQSTRSIGRAKTTLIGKEKQISIKEDKD
jgi:hypothetical protein